MMRCALPELVIGDIFIVKYKKDIKVFELNDIALWEELQVIKTVDIYEHRMRYLPRKADKIKFKQVKDKAKFTLKHGDIVTVQCRKDSTPYQVRVRSGWKNPEIIGQVHFQKMMNPTGVFR